MKRQSNWFAVYQSLQIEPKQYLIVICFSNSMSNLTILDFAICVDLCCLIYIEHGIFDVSDKVPRAKWPHGTSGNTCFRQNLDFSIGFATEISIFTLPPPLLCFLCLIYSFYRKHVSCVCNISNISNIYIQYILSTLIFFGGCFPICLGIFYKSYVNLHDF